MKKFILRFIIILLLGFTFISIFQFSSQNSSQSTSLSRKAARKLIDTFPNTKDLSETKKDKIVENSQLLIRKGAHFSIYMTVGILMMILVSTYQITIKKQFLISIIVGIIYAITDEIHQAFVPGRMASAIDVLIDTAGVLVGTIIVYFIICLVKKLKKWIQKRRGRRIQNDRFSYTYITEHR